MVFPGGEGGEEDPSYRHSSHGSAAGVFDWCSDVGRSKVAADGLLPSAGICAKQLSSAHKRALKLDQRERHQYVLECFTGYGSLVELVT